MKRMEMRASEGLELAGAGGLLLVGALLERFTSFRASFNRQFTKGPGAISMGDTLVPMIAALCTGKSDFEAVSRLRESAWAAKALQVSRVASAETVRQNLDRLGEQAFPASLALIEAAILDLLKHTRMPLTPLPTGHVALDVDPTPQDNSKTRKQGLGWTYKGFDGYCPIVAYAGVEGFLIGAEFREGQQNGQKGAPAFIANQIQRLRTLGVASVLVRLDSGFDAAETMLAITDEKADFLIAANPRKENAQTWIDQAKALPKSAWTRLPGVRNLRVAYLERVETRRHGQRTIEVRRIVRVKKRLVIEVPEAGGHQPILRRWVDFEVGSSWFTSLDLAAPDVARLYEDHGTSEQFHAELKGELDLERLPSGKFNTNALVFQFGCLAFNLLRVLGIKGKAVFRHRHPTKRKRLKTVVQELILLPARVLKGSNQLKLDLGNHPAKAALLALHRELIPPLARAA